MKKSEIIAKYGEGEYARRLEQGRTYDKSHREEKKAYREEHRTEMKVSRKEYYEEHKEEVKAAVKKYQEENPEKIIAIHQEDHRKGGKRYAKHLEDERTGLRRDRNKIRLKHRNQYRPFKQIKAPDSQLHHEWVPDTSEYRGLALVEKEAHQYGIIDVIQILDGKITVLTEEEIIQGKKNENKDI